MSASPTAETMGAKSGPIQLQGPGKYELGLFYDAYSGELIPGSPWSRSVLLSSDNTTTMNVSSFSMSVKVLSDFESTSSLLDASLEATLPLISGVGVTGSVGFLQDKRRSMTRERVVLALNLVTECKRFDYLAPKPEEVRASKIMKENASHFVAEVTYGGKAFFVFDNETGESAEQFKLKLKGALTVPGGIAKASGEVVNKSEDQSKLLRTTCTYHGDAVLEKIPQTLGQALEQIEHVRAQLISNPVPISATVVPLSVIFDDIPTKLVHRVQHSMLLAAGKHLQALSDLESVTMQLSERAGKFSSAWRGVLDEAYESALIEKSNFGQFLVNEFLPRIRSDGGVGYEPLLEKCRAVHSKFGTITTWTRWVKSREREVEGIERVLEWLEGESVPVARMPEDLDSALFSVKDERCTFLARIQLPKIAYGEEGVFCFLDSQTWSSFRERCYQVLGLLTATKDQSMRLVVTFEGEQSATLGVGVMLLDHTGRSVVDLGLGSLSPEIDESRLVVSGQRATLFWNTVSGFDSQHMVELFSSETPGTSAPTKMFTSSGSSKSILGLEPGVTYQARVRGFARNGVGSGWSRTFSFQRNPARIRQVVLMGSEEGFKALKDAVMGTNGKWHASTGSEHPPLVYSPNIIFPLENIQELEKKPLDDLLEGMMKIPEHHVLARASRDRTVIVNLGRPGAQEKDDYCDYLEDALASEKCLSEDKRTKLVLVWFGADRMNVDLEEAEAKICARHPVISLSLVSGVGQFVCIRTGDHPSGLSDVMRSLLE